MNWKSELGCPGSHLKERFTLSRPSGDLTTGLLRIGDDIPQVREMVHDSAQ